MYKKVGKFFLSVGVFDLKIKNENIQSIYFWVEAAKKKKSFLVTPLHLIYIYAFYPVY